jgi:hypothetical protein
MVTLGALGALITRISSMWMAESLALMILCGVGTVRPPGDGSGWEGEYVTIVKPCGVLSGKEGRSGPAEGASSLSGTGGESDGKRFMPGTGGRERPDVFMFLPTCSCWGSGGYERGP